MVSGPGLGFGLRFGGHAWDIVAGYLGVVVEGLRIFFGGKQLIKRLARFLLVLSVPIMLRDFPLFTVNSFVEGLRCS